MMLKLVRLFHEKDSLASFADKVAIPALEDPGWRHHLVEANLKYGP